MLHVRRFGSGPPLLALHGFTLTADQFGDLASLVNRTVVAPDLPGHGESVEEPTQVDAVVTAIAEVAHELHEPVPILGYSQGARLALLTCLEDTHHFSGLVLISGNAGIEDDQDRRNRITQDDALAARIELFGLERFLDEWTGSGLTDTTDLPAEVRARDRAIRDANTPSGLAAALRGYGQGVQPVVWDRLDAISMPVLVLAGERDEAYSSLAARMADGMPDATLQIIPDAGHDPLRDQPKATATVISTFVDGLS